MLQEKLNNIHIEGSDMSGKSTVAEEIKNQTDYKDYKLYRNSILDKPKKEHLCMLKALRDASASENDISDAFVYIISDEVREYTYRVEPYIQVGTLLIRSLAFADALDNEEGLSSLLIVAQNHPRFERSVVLGVSTIERKKKI
jgi:hypothetical protein